MSEQHVESRYGRRDVLTATCATTLAGLAFGTKMVTAEGTTVGSPRSLLHRSGAPDIAYDDLGSDDTALLFTPGWCVGRRVFASLPARCSEQHRVLALDWRGHGESGRARGDFGDVELVEDAIDLIRATRAKRVIPVALAHSGWIALELRRRMGSLIDRIVLIDWIVADAPPPFIAVLGALQDPKRWRAARDQLFAMWVQGVGQPDLERFIYTDMGSYDFDMWSRAGREISRAYTQYGSPLKAMAAIEPALPVLHLYAQPDEPGFLMAQQSYSDAHPWYHVHKLAARSHFPMFEVPTDMAVAIKGFARR
jgi:pimeloyl-ACP methyl ester carboxylesterase